jgi:hypothetical protein
VDSGRSVILDPKMILVHQMEKDHDDPVGVERRPRMCGNCLTKPDSSQRVEA